MAPWCSACSGAPRHSRRRPVCATPRDAWAGLVSQELGAQRGSGGPAGPAPPPGPPQGYMGGPPQPAGPGPASWAPAAGAPSAGPPRPGDGAPGQHSPPPPHPRHGPWGAKPGRPAAAAWPPPPSRPGRVLGGGQRRNTPGSLGVTRCRQRPCSPAPVVPPFGPGPGRQLSRRGQPQRVTPAASTTVLGGWLHPPLPQRLHRRAGPSGRCSGSPSKRRAEVHAVASKRCRPRWPVGVPVGAPSVRPPRARAAEPGAVTGARPQAGAAWAKTLTAGGRVSPIGAVGMRGPRAEGLPQLPRAVPCGKGRMGNCSSTFRDSKGRYKRQAHRSASAPFLGAEYPTLRSETK